MAAFATVMIVRARERGIPSDATSARAPFGPRKHPRQTAYGFREPLAVALDYLPRKPSGGGNRDLLPNYGADRELEAVPCAGHPQSRTLRNERRQRPIAGKMPANELDIGVEIQKTFEPHNDRRHDADVIELNRRQEVRIVLPPHFNDPRFERAPIGAAVDVSVNFLNAFDSTRAHESQHRAPVIRRLERKLEPDAMVSGRRRASKLARCLAVHVTDRRVEPPHARKTGRMGDIGNAERRLAE